MTPDAAPEPVARWGLEAFTGRYVRDGERLDRWQTLDALNALQAERDRYKTVVERMQCDHLSPFTGCLGCVARAALQRREGGDV